MPKDDMQLMPTVFKSVQGFSFYIHICIIWWFLRLNFKKDYSCSHLHDSPMNNLLKSLSGNQNGLFYDNAQRTIMCIKVP